MALQLWELNSSRPQTLGQRTKVVLKYLITGSDGDDVAAHAFFRANTPLYYGGLGRQETTLDEWDGRHWMASAEYSGATAYAQGESGYSFDTTGGSWKLLHSLGTKESVPSDAPDFGGAINVGENYDVKGVQLPLPATMAFEEKHTVPTSLVTPAYKETLIEMSRTVNATAFKGIQAGSAYFKGVRGSLKNETEWDLTFFFEGAPKRENYEAAPGLTISSADGFDYIWTAVRKEDVGGRLVSRAFAAYVEKVLERSAFGDLGIGS